MLVIRCSLFTHHHCQIRWHGGAVACEQHLASCLLASNRLGAEFYWAICRSRIAPVHSTARYLGTARRPTRINRTFR